MIDYKKQGKKNRRKGHNFEREVAKQLRSIGFANAHRHLEYQKEELYNVDIDETGEFLIQCKNKKNYVAISELAKIDNTNGMPIVVTKASRKEPIAIIRWSDLLMLIKSYIEGKV